MKSLFYLFVATCATLLATAPVFAQHDAKVRADEIVVDYFGKASPTVFAAKAYPNPSNGNLHIAYQLSSETNVAISICDLQGRVLSHVTAGETQAAGNYELPLNIAEFSNGYYFCQIATNYNTQTIRLLKID
jgi:hypothetical protein